MTINYVQINIGRNIETKGMGLMAMSAADWQEFQDDMANALLQFRECSDMGSGPVQIHKGIGEWDGIAEESAHISLFHDGGFDLDNLKEYLSGQRSYYGQDAIAFIAGSELI